MLHGSSPRAVMMALALALTACEGTLDTDPGEPEFASVSAGADGLHSCAVTTDGEAYCWGGWNMLGDLGTGSVSSPASLTDTHNTARRVTGNVRFSTISVGGGYTCGTTAKADVYCWGSNGALNAGPVDAGTPTPTLLAGARWAAVSAPMLAPCGIVPGGGVTCGVRSADGYGIATVASAPSFDSFSRHQTTLTTRGPADKPTFRLYQHQCGVSAGSVYCWGDNLLGELGNGTTVAADAPTRIASPLQFTRVETGEHFTCALAADGTAWCWGRNSYGALGKGDLVASATPVQVAGGLRFTRLSVGNYHSCAVASDGSAYCWGLNASGQLGSTSTNVNYTPSPALVSGGFRWKEISAGGRHSCGISTDSKLRCWGANEYGQLGDSTQISNVTPVPVRIER